MIAEGLRACRERYQFDSKRWVPPIQPWALWVKCPECMHFTHKSQKDVMCGRHPVNYYKRLSFRSEAEESLVSWLIYPNSHEYSQLSIFTTQREIPPFAEFILSLSQGSLRNDNISCSADLSRNVLKLSAIIFNCGVFAFIHSNLVS